MEEDFLGGWGGTWQDARRMGKFCSKDPLALPAELWIQTGELAKGPNDGFYSKLNAVLAAMDFAGQVQRICAPHFKGDALAAGRPQIGAADFLDGTAGIGINPSGHESCEITW